MFRVIIGEYLSQIESQFDSYILQLLGIPGRILVPQVTQYFILFAEVIENLCYLAVPTL